MGNIIEPPKKEDAPGEWVGTKTLSNGFEVKKKGATWYIVDENDEPISRGYHDVYIGMDGEMVGKYGSKLFEIKVED